PGHAHAVAQAVAHAPGVLAVPLGAGAAEPGRRELSVPPAVRGPRQLRRTPSAVPGSAPAGPFTPRRKPGSRRSRTGLSPRQRWLRNRWGLGLMVLLLVVVVGRLAYLQGVDGRAYTEAAVQSRLHTYPIAALRGPILDAQGRTLAYTVDASRVVADPTVVPDKARAAEELAPLLGAPASDLEEKLSRKGR